jgi:uncharacterized tellurite resistance protein B-like protein
MNYMSVFAKLYYMMINLDEKVNDKELSLGRQMVTIEGFSETEFNRQLERVKLLDANALNNELLSDLRKLTKVQQIRCIAWMCVIANADGFMDKKEWQFIYKIYHKELQISLDEIMKVQNELIRLTIYKTPNITEQIKVRA